ncbi:MAG: hypothetical protein Q9193_002041 [Seirophora villosa]
MLTASTELGPILDRLGLGRYLERFLDEGFETWETVVDITESDLREARPSTEVREDLRSENLTFTEMAKRVGEMWQALAPEEREPFEAQAGSAKEEYLAEMAQYRLSDKYKEYVEYLADFKAKQLSNAGV